MINFDFENDYILEDDFVKIIPLQEVHIDELIDIANEPDIWTYSFFKGDGKENLTNYINKTIQNREQKKEYPFAIFDKRKNKFAGCTRFYEILGPIQAIRLGYTWFGKEFQGTSLNKRCKYLLFNFAFDQMNVERIGLGAYVDNKKSIAAMKSVGCIEEGLSRNLLPAINGKGRTDAIMLSILKSDWENGAKKRLENKIDSMK